MRAIEYKGSKCAWCGYRYDGTNGAAFDFHHVDPKKDTKATVKFGWSWKKIKQEIDLCECVCVLCHRLHRSTSY